MSNRKTLDGSTFGALVAEGGTGFFESPVGGYGEQNGDHLRKRGRIESPGYEKMAAIAEAMGFPPEVWFDDGPVRESVCWSDDSRGIAGRVEHLFDVFRNPRTDEPYTNAEVDRMTLGDLSEEEVEASRQGPSATPPWARWRRWRASSGWSPPTCWTGTSRPWTGARGGPARRDGPRGCPGDLAPVRAGEAARAGDRAAVRKPGRGVASPGRQDSCLIGALLRGWRKSRAASHPRFRAFDSQVRISNY